MEAGINISGSNASGYTVIVILPKEFLAEFYGEVEFEVAGEVLRPNWGEESGSTRVVRLRYSTVPAVQHSIENLQREIAQAEISCQEGIEDSIAIPLNVNRHSVRLKELV